MIYVYVLRKDLTLKNYEEIGHDDKELMEEYLHQYKLTEPYIGRYPLLQYERFAEDGKFADADDRYFVRIVEAEFEPLKSEVLYEDENSMVEKVYLNGKEFSLQAFIRSNAPYKDRFEGILTAIGFEPMDERIKIDGRNGRWDYWGKCF